MFFSKPAISDGVVRCESLRLKEQRDDDNTLQFYIFVKKDFFLV